MAILVDTLAHVHAMLGQGDEALACATRCLTFCAANECTDWDLAFAHAEMAHAAAAGSNAQLHAKHYAEAQRLGAAIADEEELGAGFTRNPRSLEPLRRRERKADGGSEL